MNSKKLLCENPTCNNLALIRSRCRNLESELYGKKLCPGCSSLHRERIIKKAYTIPKQTQKNKDKRKSERAGYPEFFQRHIAYILANGIKCMECRTRLIGYADNVCHIIGKSGNPELALEDANILYLCGRLEGTNNCHSEFDKTLESRSKMQVFEIAQNRFDYLKDLVVKYTPEVQQLEKLI